MRMTEEQRAFYITDQGSTCPYCDSHDIGPIDEEINAMICEDCGEEWFEIKDAAGKIINIQEA